MNTSKQYTIDLHLERGMVSHIKELEALDEHTLSQGYVKVLLPSEDSVLPEDSIVFDENIWAYVAPEAKKLIEDSKFKGSVKAYLLNQPVNFDGILYWGTEIEVNKNPNDGRLHLDLKWFEKTVLQSHWFKKMIEEEVD